MRIIPSLIASTCALALFGAPTAQAQSTFTLHVYDFGFGTAQSTPVNPTIHVGDTVTWLWDVHSAFGTIHSTTSVAGIPESWDSGVQTTGGGFSFSHLFTHAGDFQYFCKIHGFDNGNQTAGGMHGEINVIPVQAVPEASTFASTALLLALGLGGLVVSVRRHKAPISH